MNTFLKKYWKTFISGSVWGALIILIISVTVKDMFNFNTPPNQTFNITIWRDSASVEWHNPRYYMIKDLEQRYFRIGMTKSQIIDIIGTPDFRPLNNDTTPDRLQYRLGINGLLMSDPYSLDIILDSNDVVKNYTTNQH